MKTIAVLGAGSWGTSLSIHLARAGHRVRLWARDPGLARDIAARRENPVYLPGCLLPEEVDVTGALDRALGGAGCVVAAAPSHGTREIMRRAAPGLEPGAVLVSATKGLETETLRRMSEVIEEETRGAHPIGVLSGPSFAVEVSRELPTAVCIASRHANVVELVQQDFRAPHFRLYGTDDVVGVEIGGALKNVIAIAAGVNEALGLGHNALAALVTRGLAEISRLACALGGRRDTLAGLTGLGDLVLTCTGTLSRNRQVGIELGRGRTLDDILAHMKMVAEGVRTTGAALALGARHQVELPIAAQMAEVLAGRKAPRAAVEELMLRRQRLEHDAVDR